MSGVDRLALVVGLTALAPGRAVLKLEDGASVPVNLTEQGGFLFGFDAPYVLVVGDGESGEGYRVPAHLFATVRAALHMWSEYEGPTRLRLFHVELESDTLLLDARDAEGLIVSLRVPRPFSVQAGHFLSPHPSDHLVMVTVLQGQLPTMAEVHATGPLPVNAYSFEITPRTLEGSACLEALGYSGRFPSTEKALSGSDN
ncbi:hypothetical protein DKM44_14055 [Deinococcus irradiatisoli]|uniref:Uncharacterized protein n=1 Tax=Deinococcus irradiatisoli TaxID=2202254 RepID=A0A2Z3JGU8_9DEIO|nr:hypothetical protein [Deinococcus irradiatisoli]AWN24215.1 hypothetical protein DKM44_14055 [Deinococcus irradiatisoli]